MQPPPRGRLLFFRLTLLEAYRAVNDVKAEEPIIEVREENPGEGLSDALSQASRVLISSNDSLVYLDLDSQNDAPQVSNYDSFSHAELVEEIHRLQMKITHLESQHAQQCTKCITQKPPPSIQQYLRQLLDEGAAGPSTIEVPVRETSNLNRVPLIDGCDILVTKVQKVNIIVEGRRNPKIMVSTFLRTFYTEEELSKISYNGTKENLGLPVQFKECLNGLLHKFHPTEDCMLQRRRVEGAYENLVKRHLFGNDTKFKEYFRLSINLFQQVLTLIEGYVAARPCNRRRQPISVAEKLCLTLRYLATGESFRSLAHQ
ncbi:hypothetical protein JTE90_011641 [Oedothorax gibbosus]|uniref:Uncharacterized protein n=1 Tax=Oedothorax gibbosus TaxID=931172 RepID=A0AAV6TUI0_9ARAC|nr:hypothetical protein JTE90_011641 [Oedothorax gibbosus]